MARTKKAEIKISEPFFSSVSSYTRRIAGTVLLLALCLLLTLSGFGVAGIAGDSFFTFGKYLVGIWYFALPLTALFVAISLVRKPADEQVIRSIKVIGGGVLLVCLVALTEIALPGHGGVVGYFVSHPLVLLFDIYAAALPLIALSIIAALVIFDSALDIGIARFIQKIRDLLGFRFDRTIEGTDTATNQNMDYEARDQQEDQGYEDSDEDTAAYQQPVRVLEKEKPRVEKGEKEVISQPPFIPYFGPYTPPPLSLLIGDRGKAVVGDSKASSNLIKRTLLQFGIKVDMADVDIGPSVSRFSLKPAEGVRLSRIIALQSNLELALAAAPLRIEAPIPGKSLVGIEVPNATKSTVGIASLLSAEEFTKSTKPLLTALGKDITGIPWFTDIAKMPHALIAGATGSGKSVAIHSIIVSLLYKNGPERLRLILIDPKRIDFTAYNGIPHLYGTPVITDARQAILALKWAAKEMERRFDILSAAGVRDVGSYHAEVLAPAQKKREKKGETDEDAEPLPDLMPHILIIIDELADIMQSYPRELEASIVRLAQKSRAAGIHLILSTQRPSVNVITGLIKANIPTRIALKVISQIDSRTILDSQGAEKLLGAGDMLFQGSDMPKPVRLQSAFITVEEVRSLVSFLIKNDAFGVQSGIDFGSVDSAGTTASGTVDEGGDDDALYEEAREVVISAGKASTSLLQRKLRIGYSRAARLMDLLQERSVIGNQDGSKPRDVLIPNSEDES